eukprot:1528541-Heterocapsa_arctica.AAC.1
MGTTTMTKTWTATWTLSSSSSVRMTTADSQRSRLPCQTLSDRVLQHNKADASRTTPATGQHGEEAR